MATEYTSIRVSKEAFEKAQEMKAEHQTWNEYVTDENRGGVDLDELAERLAEDRQEQLEEVVGAVCGDVATLEDIRDLSKQLPERTADEVEGRLR